MSEESYHIRVRKGHQSRLRFWFAPVSREIMNADADWLEKEELSCDNICTHELFYPFIQKHFPGEFKWRNEINIMPFSNVREMVHEVRSVSRALENDYHNPRLIPYKKNFAIDLLVNAEEYDAKYSAASDSVKIAAVEEHKEVIIEFYKKICDYLDSMCTEYEPKGFLGIAICAPH